jgi:hypothetical protein
MVGEIELWGLLILIKILLIEFLRINGNYRGISFKDDFNRGWSVFIY